jgi:hypothetical protein
MNLDKAAAYIKSQIASGALDHKDIARLVERAQLAMGLDADGLPGPITLARLDGFFIEADLTPPPMEMPVAFDGPLERIPRNTPDLIAMLGNPAKPDGSENPAWRDANIVTAHDLPGVPPKWHFMAHRKIMPYIREGFRRAGIAAPEYVIERAAAYVFRHMRHDPNLPLSKHSWGAALDIDPALNGAATFKVGQEPVPFSPAWRVRWPQGLPQAFVEAFESVGFAWGGRWKGFVDPMHFEFVGKSTAQV